jgi:hypothetical protein
LEIAEGCVTDKNDSEKTRQGGENDIETRRGEGQEADDRGEREEENHTSLFVKRGGGRGGGGENKHTSLSLSYCSLDVCTPLHT